jgi:hypothetical protein
VEADENREVFKMIDTDNSIERQVQYLGMWAFQENRRNEKGKEEDERLINNGFKSDNVVLLNQLREMLRHFLFSCFFFLSVVAEVLLNQNAFAKVMKYSKAKLILLITLIKLFFPYSSPFEYRYFSARMVRNCVCLDKE